ncbi:MAG: hypothetical protein LBR11_01285 [Deltaproteobacteria bacterium]|jgi:hypothetical protein|nr:hypothetical protein [Deltaproteobacteria bacterium]
MANPTLTDSSLDEEKIELEPETELNIDLGPEIEEMTRPPIPRPAPELQPPSHPGLAGADLKPEPELSPAIENSSPKKSSRAFDPEAPAVLAALAEANFNWVQQSQGVWALTGDIPGIHNELRKKFDRHLSKLKNSPDQNSLPGLIVLGNPGAGKTHLLGSFWRQTIEKKGFFLMVDMLAVNSFHDTMVEHLLNSLAAPGPDGRVQAYRLAENILRSTRSPGERLPANFDQWLTTIPYEYLKAKILETIKRLHKMAAHFDKANRFADLIRALFYFCSSSQSLACYGRLWLVGGLDNSPGTLKTLQFTGPRMDPVIVIQGLSWLMSLNGSFSVLAIDQLDSIIKLYSVILDAPKTEERDATLIAAQRVMNEVSAGLGALINITYKSTTILSLLPDSNSALNRFGLKPSIQRYAPCSALVAISRLEDMVALVAARLAPAFQAHNLTPPYPSWPFPPRLFEPLAGHFNPRHILRICQQYLDNCLARERVDECQELPGLEDDFPASQDLAPSPVKGLSEAEPIPSTGQDKGAKGPEDPKIPPSPDPKPLSVAEIFEDNCQKVELNQYKESMIVEAVWAETLKILAYCVRDEEGNSAMITFDPASSPKQPEPWVSILWDPGPKPAGQGIERLLSLWVILASQPIAFQTRLKKALTQSGIDRDLPARKLAIIRFEDDPPGGATAELVKKFTSLGGIWTSPSDTDLRILGGLTKTYRANPLGLKSWLKKVKPSEKIESLRELIAWIKGRSAPPLA